jgi:hypothetical protein
MGDEGFYVTLPSTASMGVFPDNTSSNWITLMTPPIELDNTPWEVSLAEIHMPNKWENITEDNNSFDITFGDMERMLVLETVSSNPIIAQNQQAAGTTAPRAPGLIAFSHTNLTRPIGGARFSAIPHDQALHVEFQVDPDKVYTRDDYMQLMQQHFTGLAEEERGGIKLGDSVNVMYRSFYRDGQTSYLYEINFNDDWVFLYDCWTIEKLHTPLSRFWGVVPSDIIDTFPPQTRVHKYDNLNGELPEYTSKLTNHKYYLFNTKVFDRHKGLTRIQRPMISMNFKTITCRLKPGCYSTPERLVDAIMEVLPRQCKEYFKLSVTESKTLRISSYNYHYFSIMFSSENASLGPMLGLLNDHIDVQLPERPVDLEPTGLYQGTYPIDINRGVFGFYIYCDLVMPEYVGDTKANLLRVVPANSDNLIVHDYSKGAHYKPLCVKQIAKIHIVVKTDSNQELQFTSGKTLCKLHFRKTQL